MKKIWTQTLNALKSPRMFYPTLGLVIIATLLLIGLFTDSPLNVANWFVEEQETKGSEIVAEEPILEEEVVEEKVPEAEEKPEENSEPIPESSISLTAVKYDNGIKLYWENTNLNASQGYKIVKSTEINPIYPGDTYKYISNESQKSYAWSLTDGKTYYFRVCQYLGGKCGIYSNNVKLTAPLIIEEPKEEAAVRSIKLSFVGLLATSAKSLTTIVEPVEQQAKVSWLVDGYSKYGFKLVFSKSPNPTYPTRSTDRYEYYSSPSQVHGIITAFDGPGKYYVRVCEYLGGKCGLYSNQIEINFFRINQ